MMLIFATGHPLSVDEQNIEQEEFLANWVASYGREVIQILDDLLGKVDEKRKFLHSY